MRAPPLLPLAQQVVVVTGASSGIGLCTARLAAARGACVVLVARSGQVLYRASSEIDNAGGRSIAVPADVASREQLEAVARAAIQAFGRIDTWINNAGVSIHGRLDVVTEEDSQRLFATNFWGVVNGSLAALPHLKKQGGALINIGRDLSQTMLPLQGMYASSKLAVRGFTDALRVELDAFDGSPVSVTLIEPTAVNTPHAELARRYSDLVPTPPDAMLDPIDVAEAILRAATQDCRHMRLGDDRPLSNAKSTGSRTPASTEKASVPAAGRWPGSVEAAPATAGALYGPSSAARTHGRLLA